MLHALRPRSLPPPAHPARPEPALPAVGRHPPRSRPPPLGLPNLKIFTFILAQFKFSSYLCTRNLNVISFIIKACEGLWNLLVKIANNDLPVTDLVKSLTGITFYVKTVQKTLIYD